ncbi:MAG: sugar phosphate nucleotidyltransferase [Pseudomonadota bacterium]
MMPFTDLSPVILAGGSGTRLWPLSRRRFPKHLIGLDSDRTLLQTTADRVLRTAPPGSVFTLGAVDQSALLQAQLAAVDPALVRGLVLEPAARNTAAACATAALVAQEHFGPDQLLWVCAADHLMTMPDALYTALALAAAAARTGRIVTFGIEPAYPEPGFGYIATGAPLAETPGVSEVARFVEKPDVAAAQAMIEAGGHLWNSGMFVFRAGTFLDELARHAPDIHEATVAAVAGGGGAPFVPGASYGGVPSAPVDTAVMERSDRIAVVPCDPGWSDVGSWHAVWEVSPKDASGNAVLGDGWVQGAQDCLLVARDRLVAAVGVRDLAIIDTADAVMVADRNDSAAVKAIVGRLGEAGRPEAVDFPREAFGWGERRLVLAVDAVTVAEIIVQPGAAAVVTAANGADVEWVDGRGAVRLRVAAGDEGTLRNETAEVLRLVEWQRSGTARGA